MRGVTDRRRKKSDSRSGTAEARSDAAGRKELRRKKEGRGCGEHEGADTGSDVQR